MVVSLEHIPHSPVIHTVIQVYILCFSRGKRLSLKKILACFKFTLCLTHEIVLPLWQILK